MRESLGAEVIRAWLKDSIQRLGVKWEDDDSPVDVDDSPLDQLLEAVFDWQDRSLSDALKYLGYSRETIGEFRDNQFELASAVEGPNLPIGHAATIDPTREHGAARDIRHMLLIDGFELLRAARSYAAQAMYTNMLRCLQLNERHYSIFHKEVWPVYIGTKGGHASGEVRRKQSAAKLDSAARAYGQLREKNEYTMREPKKPAIEEAAGLLKGSLRKISLRKIRVRAAELRSRKGSD